MNLEKQIQAQQFVTMEKEILEMEKQIPEIEKNKWSFNESSQRYIQLQFLSTGTFGSVFLVYDKKTGVK